MTRLIVFLVMMIGSIAEGSAAEKSLPQVFSQVSAAVVVVRTNERVLSRQSGADGAVSVAKSGIGSGVVINAEGQVITAAHVVQSADAVAVEFVNGTVVRARVIVSDPAADVALLQLDRLPPGTEYVNLGDSDAAQVGEQVFVVGAPFGESHTLTVGHISARRRPKANLGGAGFGELLQTDAAISQGNSGGPMFNMQGEVIGIVSHILSHTGGSEGVGFVVTSNIAQRLLFDEPTMWSGLDGYLLTGLLARALNLPGESSGLLVQRVSAGSPAERIGLRGGYLPAEFGEQSLIVGGDIVLAVDGIPIGEANWYEMIRQSVVKARRDKRAVRVAVLREGQTLELSGS
jgi:S1-C subfamily serine protease